MVGTGSRPLARDQARPSRATRPVPRARPGPSLARDRRAARRGDSHAAGGELRPGAVARDDRLEIAAGGQRSVLEATAAFEARGAEGVGDRGRRMANQQGGLQCERHVLHEATCPGFERLRLRLGVVKGGAELREVGVEARIGAGCLLDLGEEHLRREGCAGERAQHVERHHVARPLPDRHQRRLAVQTRHPGVLHVAVAAEALHRLVGVVRCALAHPVLARPPWRGA